MNTSLSKGKAQFLLTFKSKMTFEFAGEIEDMILDALRRYTYIQVDLSNVTEIDICGIHLLGLLESFANKGVEIIATSPAIEKAYERRESRFRRQSRIGTSENAQPRA
jgi:anti-anti-sigma regulatory factor